jgi:hypothetical protein
MNILADSDLLVIAVNNGTPTGLPLTYSNFRMLYPQTSFPVLPDTACLADFGYAVFQYVSAPSAPALTTVSEGPITFDAARDAWTNTWVETPFTFEQVSAAADAALSALILNRNVLLYQCDWTQLPDVDLSVQSVADWRTYRQALRDYPDTVDDAFNPPAWPTPPVS